MALFIQNDATGAGAGSLAPNQAFVDLATIANGDTGLGLAAQAGNQQQVTYARTLGGPPPTRLDNLVNTTFNPDYGLGAGPQAVNIIILPVLANFTLNDGRSILTVGGTSLPPSNSGLVGAVLNTTNNCLVIYDTTQNNAKGYCTARAGTGGTLDLQTPNPVILYHELSHAFRIVNNGQLAVTAACNPSSPEEHAAIVDENDMRTQLAAAGTTPVLRDPGNHCGAVCSGGGTPPCCTIIASVASGSPLSTEVLALRALRDSLLRKNEVGFSFFELLHHDYYAFSPQVCVLMAQHPDLQKDILEGFVRPLVNVFGLIERYALGGGNAAAIGEQFVAANSDRVASVRRLGMLALAREVLSGGDAEITHEQRELAKLLYPALKSEHVVWALIQPLQIYESALHSQLAECEVDKLGKQICDAIDSWTCRMPLDDVWAGLAAEEVRAELGVLDSVLLHSAEARTNFRDRLRKRFGDITSVVTALSSEQNNA
jgi:hypothetical protein